MERWHSTLKSNLTEDYHKEPLTEITKEVEASVRSWLRDTFLTDAEQIPPSLEFGEITSQSVCQRMISGDWIWTERTDFEDTLNIPHIHLS